MILMQRMSKGCAAKWDTSPKVLLDACADDGVEPRKHFSGKFSLRVDPATHEATAAHGQSLN
jgi:predicted HicB family RNase H-like nuclease